MSKVRLLFAGIAILCVTLAAHADTVFGVPVSGMTGAAANTQAVPNCPALEGTVCYDTSTHKTTFFIPINASDTGIYGTTNVGTASDPKYAGTFSDTGTGTGYTTASALTMFLKFSPVALPVGTATLSLLFTDLDLNGVNDPTGFFESVRFYSSNGTAITPVITNDPASGVAGGGYLAYSVSGGVNTQTIFFPDVTSILQNPFYVELTFGSKYTGTGQNTPEDLVATLETTRPAPEPASLVLLGVGLLGLGSLVRRRG